MTTKSYQQFSAMGSDPIEPRWDVISSKQWEGASDVKAAEFLVEERVSILECLRGVATMTAERMGQVVELLRMAGMEKPAVVRRDWYF